MQQAILITGTDTGVGKTNFACTLGFAAHAHGLRTGVMKPAETGCAEGSDGLVAADAAALQIASSAPHRPELICPFRYRSPLAPAAAAEKDGLPPPSLEHLARCFEQIAADSDIVLVEGAGGLSVPLTWEANYADLALALELEMVLVVANRLGAINATILTLDYAARRGLPILGYVLNDAEPVDSPAAATNEDSLRHLTKVPYLGRIRHREPLPPAITRAVLRPLAAG